MRAGTTTQEREPITARERENRELRQPSTKLLIARIGAGFNEVTVHISCSRGMRDDEAFRAKRVVVSRRCAEDGDMNPLDFVD
jgi:hypothetical protein